VIGHRAVKGQMVQHDQLSRAGFQQINQTKLRRGRPTRAMRRTCNYFHSHSLLCNFPQYFGCFKQQGDMIAEVAYEVALAWKSPTP
jgi:hypothetical protein